jgi:hypothetical protein
MKKSGDQTGTISKAGKKPKTQALTTTRYGRLHQPKIWSVTSAEGDDGSEWIITGPPHHFCNHLGHLATKERHDNNTYYEECWLTAEEAAEREEL